jgi:hypothetical protein
MPKTFQGLGMSFHYPDNWRIVEMAEDPQAIDAVSFESPETAVLHISRYPASREPDQLLEDAVRSMREEFDEVEQEDLLFDLGDSESFGCDLTFFVLDLIVTSRLLSFQLGEHTYLVQMQAEDREFEKHRGLLRAMVLHGLQTLPGHPSLEEFPA